MKIDTFYIHKEKMGAKPTTSKGNKTFKLFLTINISSNSSSDYTKYYIQVSNILNIQILFVL